ncbi:MAG: mercuric ion transporter MerT [Gemmatimonadota bacterium]
MEILRKSMRSQLSRPGGGALFVGGVAAVLASVCCLGPLILLMLGISGAWIGNLTALEPYRPIFVAASAGALYFAHKRIFRPAADCKPGEICAVPAINRSYRIFFWVAVALLAVALAFPFIAPLFY